MQNNRVPWQGKEKKKRNEQNIVCLPEHRTDENSINNDVVSTKPACHWKYSDQKESAWEMQLKMDKLCVKEHLWTLRNLDVTSQR